MMGCLISTGIGKYEGGWWEEIEVIKVAGSSLWFSLSQQWHWGKPTLTTSSTLSKASLLSPKLCPICSISLKMSCCGKEQKTGVVRNWTSLDFNKACQYTRCLQEGILIVGPFRKRFSLVSRDFPSSCSHHDHPSGSPFQSLACAQTMSTEHACAQLKLCYAY